MSWWAQIWSQEEEDDKQPVLKPAPGILAVYEQPTSVLLDRLPSEQAES